jgi:GTPase SAR1 family protein
LYSALHLNEFTAFALSLLTMISGHSMINTHQFKVLVVGSAGAGKTALVKSILNSGFDEKYVPTLGACSV